MHENNTIPDEIIKNKIYLIRDCKVMLDRDLAILYGVETKRLKEAVRRNLTRFPEDFMFEMTVNEFEHWRGDYELTKEDKMGLRYAPFCFTEPITFSLVFLKFFGRLYAPTCTKYFTP